MRAFCEFRGLCCALLVIGTIAGSGAEALMIDDFGAGSTNFVGPGGTFDFSQAGSMLGGERDETLSNFDISGGILAGATGTSYDYNAVNAEGSALLVWDGADGSPAIDHRGLDGGSGGADFTDGGLTAGFQISFEANNIAAPLTLTVFSSATNFSSFTVLSPGGIPSGPPMPMFIAFADFVPSGAGADFSDVGAFSIEIDGSSEDQLDMTLAFIETVPVPEPATFAQLSLGLLGLSWMARRPRRG